MRSPRPQNLKLKAPFNFLEDLNIRIPMMTLIQEEVSIIQESADIKIRMHASSRYLGRARNPNSNSFSETSPTLVTF